MTTWTLCAHAYSHTYISNIREPKWSMHRMMPMVEYVCFEYMREMYYVCAHRQAAELVTDGAVCVLPLTLCRSA